MTNILMIPKFLRSFLLTHAIISSTVIVAPLKVNASSHNSLFDENGEFNFENMQKLIDELDELNKLDKEMDISDLDKMVNDSLVYTLPLDSFDSQDIEQDLDSIVDDSSVYTPSRHLYNLHDLEQKLDISEKESNEFDKKMQFLDESLEESYIDFDSKASQDIDDINSLFDGNMANMDSAINSGSGSPCPSCYGEWEFEFTDQNDLESPSPEKEMELSTENFTIANKEERLPTPYNNIDRHVTDDTNEVQEKLLDNNEEENQELLSEDSGEIISANDKSIAVEIPIQSQKQIVIEEKNTTAQEQEKKAVGNKAEHIIEKTLLNFREESLNPIAKRTEETDKENIKHAPHHYTLANIENIITTVRLSTDDLNNIVNSQNNINTTAVAAGDEKIFIAKGFWIRGLYGISNQNLIHNIPGYKGISRGGTIGFDVKKDDNVIGIAYSQLISIFKFKTNKNIDKEFVYSHIFSIYGQKELPKNLILQSIASAACNHVKNITGYLINNINYKTAGKYRNNSYSIASLLNYNYYTKRDLTLVPNIGLRYGASHDGTYNENGVNVQDVLVTTKPHNILTGIVGSKITAPIRDVNKKIIAVLTFYASIERNFSERTQRIRKTTKQDNYKYNYIMPKQPKTAYNLGANISTDIRKMQISLDYNCHLRKSYQSHQGSIKLKINF